MAKSFTKLYSRAVIGCAAILLGAVTIIGGMTMFSRAAVTEVMTFNYTGSVQSVELSAGNYMLETWGATGSGSGGKGGYAAGMFTTASATTIYVVVGGRPYNGGGSSNGGGATHMATVTGILSSLSSTANQEKVLIVAGGGGGGSSGSGGAGGGTSGNGGASAHEGVSYSSTGFSASITANGGSGGTQTTSGSGGSCSGTYSGTPPTISGSRGTGTGAGGGGGWRGGGGGSGGGAVIVGPTVSRGSTGSSGSFGQGGSGGSGSSGGTAFAACGGGGGGGGSGYVNSILSSGKNLKTGETGFVTNPDSTGPGYARITPIHVNVSFNGNKPTTAQYSVTGGQSTLGDTSGWSIPSSVNIPSLTGWNFSGYYTSSSGGTQMYNRTGNRVTTATITADTIYYAQWAPKTNDITFTAYTDGDTVFNLQETISHTSGNQIQQSVSVAEREGYSFVGYWNDETGGTQFYDNTGKRVSNNSLCLNNPLALYAKWSYNYSLLFSGNAAIDDVTNVQEEIIHISGTVIQQEVLVPTRSDYAFAGYWSEATGGTLFYDAYGTRAISTPQSLGSNKTLYAHWSYDVTLDLNGAENTLLQPKGLVQSFSYTGGIQSTTLEAGTYQFETWGAKGGTSSSYAGTGGVGGYSVGTFTITSTTVVYIVVGGMPSANSSGTANGGYNGGGSGATGRASNHGGAGGGATHVATATGTLNQLSNSKTSVLMVAGGGGGSGGGSQGGASNISSGNAGGNGGGNNGNTGVSSSAGSVTTANGGGAGTQSAGGSGGTRSASNSSSSDRTYNPGGGGGGGGGWYGGGGGAGGSRSNNGSATLGTAGSIGSFGLGGAGGAGATAGTAYYSCGGGSGGGGSGYVDSFLTSAATYLMGATGFTANPVSSGHGFARISEHPLIEIAPPMTVTLIGNASTVLPIQTLKKENRVFIGWNTRPDGTGKSFAPGTVVNNYSETAISPYAASHNNLASGNITLYAEWAFEEVTITFGTNGGNHIDSISFPLDITSLTSLKPTDPTRAGHTFTGWYKDEELTEPFDFDTEDVPASDITLYANWAAETYTVVYHFNGGNHPVIRGSVTFGETFNLVVPSRNLHSFDGWFSMDGETQYTNDEGNSITAWDEDPNDSEIHVLAKWTKIGFVISFVTYSDETLEPIIAWIGSDMSDLTPEEPTRKGYMFDKWLNELGSEYDFNSENLPSSDITLYAVWVANKYTVVYNSNGGSLEKETDTVTWGSTFTLAVPKLAHNNFLGWFNYDGKRITNVAGKSDTYIWDIDINNFNLYAHWEAVQYEMRFDFNDGERPWAVISYAYDELIPNTLIPETYERDFALFQGWFTPEGEEFDFKTRGMPANGISLTARWTADVSRLQTLVSELHGYLEFEGFDQIPFEKFLEAMDNAAGILDTSDPTINNVKMTYDDLLAAAIELTIADSTGKVIPPDEFRPSNPPSNTWVFVLLGCIILIIAAALAAWFVIMKRKEKEAA